MSDMSDYDDEMDSPNPMTPGSSSSGLPDDPKRHARAQHNALERRRRDNIKDMYVSLKDSVPEMQNERASRAVILRKAIDSIEDKVEKQTVLQKEVQDLKGKNDDIRRQIEALKREKQASSSTDSEQADQRRDALQRAGFNGNEVLDEEGKNVRERSAPNN